MQNSHRMRLPARLAGLIILSMAIPALSSPPTPQATSSTDIPVVKGGGGSCTADFTVKDASGKGIYDAKIEIQVKYGFLGTHRIDATVGTNSDGKARFEGLPEQIKKTAEFRVSHAGLSKTLPYDPLTECHPKPEVVLGDK